MNLSTFCDTIRSHLLNRGYTQEQVNTMHITSLNVQYENKKLDIELSTYEAKNGKDVDVVTITSQ